MRILTVSPLAACLLESMGSLLILLIVHSLATQLADAKHLHCSAIRSMIQTSRKLYDIAVNDCKPIEQAYKQLFQLSLANRLWVDCPAL